jgi:hypothetical protein
MEKVVVNRGVGDVRINRPGLREGRHSTVKCEGL